MSKLRCYIKPFNDAGVYQDWIEVTSDVDFKSMGSVSSKLESSEFDVGVFTFGSVSLKLNNADGDYSDIDDINSIFRFRRSGSKVKITWQKGDTDAVCGFDFWGECYPYYELTILEGLLNDEALTQDLRISDVTFKVLSYTSIFKTIETPFSSLSNGDKVSEIFDVLLADPTALSTITVTPVNININYDAVIDDVSSYEDTDISEVINNLLIISNSVLYFKDDSIYISDRTATATVQETFYGQASSLGVENVQKLDKIRSGLSRTFNLWRWEDTALSSKNTSSIDDNGLRVKEIGFKEVTNNTTRQAILDSYKTEFQDPEREFTFTTNLDVENRDLLDRVNFDYPTPYFASEGVAVPRYDLAVYDVDKYPVGEYGLTLDTLEYFKIISIKIDLKKDLITYEVREI